MSMNVDNNNKTIEKYRKNMSLLPYFTHDFVLSLISDGKAARTVHEYTKDLLNFFEYVRTLEQFENTDMDKASAKDVLEAISVVDLERYKLYLADYNPDRIKSSAASISRKLSTVRTMYRYFFNTEAISSDISSKVSNPKLQKKEISVLHLNEVDAIYEAIDTPPSSKKQLLSWEKTHLRDKAIITLFFGTGLRVSELVSIDLKDINYTTAEIKVQRKGDMICTVNFNEDVEETIKDYVENERPTLLDGEKSDALFISTAHQRITTRAVEQLIKKYALIAGIGANVTPHELRRTYGNTLYKETGDIYLTAAALNHKNIQTTISHYVPKNDEKLKEASRRTTLTRKIQK